MSTFERYLTLWVAACIVVGICLGHRLPAVLHAGGEAEIAKVNLFLALRARKAAIAVTVSPVAHLIQSAI